MYYVILSNGAYSDYTPNYFCGETEINQEQFTKKGREVGDMVELWFASLPKRPHKAQYSWDHDTEETYDPVTGERIYPYQISDKWEAQMEAWLTEMGYQPLPGSIPEINISYSDIPTSRDAL